MKTHIAILFCLFLLIGSTRTASADVIINEVAWMGTTTSVNDEWIELYNNGTSAVTLDGWTLISADAAPTINLSGTVGADAYFLLERTDDTTVPGVTAGMIYAGALGNEGETLTLKNNTEAVQDTVVMAGGWTAGNSVTKETMQKSGSSWITGAATPGALNVTTGTDPVDNGGDDDTVDTDSEGSDSSESSSSSSQDNKDETIVIKPDPVYASKMVTPDIFVQHVPIKFESEVKKDGMFTSLRGRFEWSMGDGKSFIFRKSTPFTYEYQEPGQYVVMLRYYSNIFGDDASTLHRKTITVIPASVSLSVDRLTNTITLENKSTDDMDLAHWLLKSGRESFEFPMFTILSKGSSIHIPQSVHELSHPTTNSTILVTPTGHLASGNWSSSSTQMGNYSSQTSVMSEQTANEVVGVETLFESAETISAESNSFNNRIGTTGALLIILFIILILGMTIGFYYMNRRIEELNQSNQEFPAE